MVNEILGVLAGGAIGCVGYLFATLKATKREVQKEGVLHDKEARIKELIQKCNEHSNAKKVIQEELEAAEESRERYKKAFEDLAEEHAARKEANTKLAEGNNAIAKDYHALKDKYEVLLTEHKELQEKYKPLAALNPFERQAVGAVTNQSILDEWMNGEIKEGN